MSEIYTVEEIAQNNIQLAGTGQKSDFVVSTRTDRNSKRNAVEFRTIKRILNKSLKISTYSSQIKHISFILITLNPGKGVDWNDKKYSNDNEINLEIKIPDYEVFCNATKQDALRIMASEILRGSEKFLKDEPDFDFPKFYDDVKALFVEKGLG